LKVACNPQVKLLVFRAVGSEGKAKHRSGCPVSVSLEVFGDRWSLLVVRDLMIRGYRTFKDFLQSGEGIASNILADRLQRLEKSGVLYSEAEASDGRRVNYRLTEKGIELAPVLLEMLIWGSRHEECGASCAFADLMERDRESILAETRRRWEARDATPILPSFQSVVEKKPKTKRNVTTSRSVTAKRVGRSAKLKERG